MNRADAQRVVRGWLARDKQLPTHSLPHQVRRAKAVLQRHDEAAADVPDTPHQCELALQAHKELSGSGEAYKKRAECRERLADYIEDQVLPHHQSKRLLDTPEKLRAARRTGTWGTRPDGSLVTIWDDKSGLVRLDPDDAREESQRLAERYIPELLKLSQDGCGLHYMVMTEPNVPLGELAIAKKAQFRNFVAFLKKQCNNDPLLPEIKGALVVQEDPLAANGQWNLHLNVILVTDKRWHEGLYAKIRKAWHFNVHMEPLKANSAASLTRTFNEIIKYSARVVPEKSDSKRHQSDAPAMIEWTPAQFVEWFDAQPRFRRTRSYGCLYGSKVPHPEPMSLDNVTWHGALFCSSGEFVVRHPLIEFTPGDKSAKRHLYFGFQKPPD